MFFVYGSDVFFVQKKIFTLIENEKADVIQFFPGDNLDLIGDNVANLSLFESKKIFIFNNFLQFSPSAKINKVLIAKIKKTQHLVIFKYIFDENFSKNDLKSSVIYKTFSPFAKLFETTELNSQNVVDFIKKVAMKFKLNLTSADLTKIESQLPLKGQIIYNEISKLSSLNCKINSSIIENFVSDYFVTSPWDFVNSFVNFDLKSTLNFYRQKLLEGVTLSLLIGQINSKLSLSFMVYLYKQIGFSNTVIAQKMSISSFQVNKAVDLYKNIGIQKLQKLIIDLAILDTRIKKSKINDKLGFEVFLLSLVNKNF
ncbi:DNA polymerase III subunit delta [Mycoplasma sp. 'Moose RK']|uniref:DNA polymerase III subunit delta n=1 Tax=Mycoplasma sp. 'Moose RK' TaxID=2780095 RepID=UPI0018C28D50|nr:DNA polymerase III subunit delta [Mycoplasma sp. 'Moose RK']MBG0730898.1 DNA polymerase III subunit delta [Mycoplasma sp. 'Moose RK']